MKADGRTRGAPEGIILVGTVLLDATQQIVFHTVSVGIERDGVGHSLRHLCRAAHEQGKDPKMKVPLRGRQDRRQFAQALSMALDDGLFVVPPRWTLRFEPVARPDAPSPNGAPGHKPLRLTVVAQAKNAGVPGRSSSRSAAARLIHFVGSGPGKIGESFRSDLKGVGSQVRDKWS